MNDHFPETCEQCLYRLGPVPIEGRCPYDEVGIRNEARFGHCLLRGHTLVRNSGCEEFVPVCVDKRRGRPFELTMASIERLGAQDRSYF